MPTSDHKPPLTLHMPFPTLSGSQLIELTAVDGLLFSTPYKTSKCVFALLTAGVPAVSVSCQVYAETSFATAWPIAVARYRTTPKTGGRLQRAITRTQSIAKIAKGASDA